MYFKGIRAVGNYSLCQQLGSLFTTELSFRAVTSANNEDEDNMHKTQVVHGYRALAPSVLQIKHDDSTR